MRILIILRSKSQTLPAAKPLLTHSFKGGFTVSRESGERRERKAERAERGRESRAESVESGEGVQRVSRAENKTTTHS
jgi:hypothetical protein